MTGKGIFSAQEQGRGPQPRAVQAVLYGLALLWACLIGGWLWGAWRADAANHDVFWLFTGFLRLQSGQTMAQAFYETNPPLSVYIYAPAFWLTELTGLSLPRAVIVYTSVLLAAALAASLYAARHLNGCSRQQGFVLALGLGVAGTVMAATNYGQRDHFVALAAIPVVLLLLGRTQSARRLNLAGALILFTGTLFLLLKPYYGLLPAYLMAHRACTQKRLSALWDADFIVMALAPLAYGLCFYFFFQDYLTIILPAVLDLYIDSGWRYSLALLSAIASLWLLLMGLSGHRAVPVETRALVRQLLVFAALGFLIYVLMMKGYAYHLLPCLTFMLVAGLLLGNSLLKPLILGPALRAFAMALPLTALCLLMPDSYIPHKDQVEREALTKKVAACEGDCSFLIMGSTVRIAQLISYYTDKPHASRFPKFWFAEGMVEEGLDLEKDHRRLERYRHYVDMITADIDHYKPRIIFSCNYYADFMPWLSSYENFRRAFGPYRKTADLWYDHDIFHHGKSAPRPRIVKCAQYDRIGG